MHIPLSLDPIFHAAPMVPEEARRTFALVQMFDRTLALPDWLAYTRSMSRKDQASGLITLKDNRGYAHAIFCWFARNSLTHGRVLRVSDVVIAGLPGREIVHAVIDAVRNCATTTKCDAIIFDLDQPIWQKHVPANMLKLRSALIDAGFSAVASEVLTLKQSLASTLHH